jgi:hypothetical protein
MHVHTRPVPPSQRIERPISPQVEQVVLACLDKDPDRRPQDAEQLLQRLQRCTGPEWSEVSARQWWKAHLPSLAGPLPLADAVARPTTSREPAEYGTQDVTIAPPVVDLSAVTRLNRLRAVFSRRP